MRSVIARLILPVALLTTITICSTASAGVVVKAPEAAIYAHASSSGGTAQQQSAMGSNLESAWNSPLVQAVSSGTGGASSGAFGNLTWDPSQGFKCGVTGVVGTNAVSAADLIGTGECILVVSGAAVPYTFDINVSSTSHVLWSVKLYDPSTNEAFVLDEGNASYTHSYAGSLPQGTYACSVRAEEILSNGEQANVTAGFDLKFGNYASMARITSQPPGVIVDPNQPVPTLTLPISDTGDGTQQEHWYCNGGALHDGAGVSGSGTKTLTITNFAAVNNGDYTCVVSNAFASDTSDIAVCELGHVSTVPQLTLQPRDQVLDPNLNLFTLRAFASGPLSYQWRHGSSTLLDGDLPSGAVIVGAQSPMLLIQGGTTAELGTYQCTITDDFGSVLSRSALLTSGIASVESGTGGELQFSARPNPTRGASAFTFVMPARGDARLEVFDVGGRRVATLAAGPMEEGIHIVTWNLTRADGRPVPAGLYLARLRCGATSSLRRLAVIR